MENKTYCRECGSRTFTIKVGFDNVCSQCGFIHGSYIEFNKVIGWALAVLFFVLWMIKH